MNVLERKCALQIAASPKIELVPFTVNKNPHSLLNQNSDPSQTHKNIYLAKFVRQDQSIGANSC